ncbi:hypothetical protein F5972_08595 [Microbispora cellulosiformans]|uniref:Recombinase zinc beta ribbon domain-containing protein n=1 Tax=Microbispora cellulosiformans TaxID=2614688 RepID=A0A5J5K8B7_9ACTN|nr:hypothetical protein [Microbispora cellulosiformans]KAA9379699.1 hypothetical protein F5972_08595 [Microbispora cellulosiformans]
MGATPEMRVEAVLHGLARCGRCDGRELAEHLDADGRAYVCFTRRPGGCTRADADHMEWLVAVRTLAAFDRAMTVHGLTRPAPGSAPPGAGLPAVDNLPGLVHWWHSAGSPQQRAFLRALLDHLTVRTGDGEFTERVELTWKT